jgi:hypothetical protein
MTALHVSNVAAADAVREATKNKAHPSSDPCQLGAINLRSTSRQRHKRNGVLREAARHIVRHREDAPNE